VLSLLDAALAIAIVLGVVFRPLSGHEDEPMTTSKS
jgi:hypothetical protein